MTEDKDAPQARPVIYVDNNGVVQSSVSSEQVEALLGPVVDSIRATRAAGDAEAVAWLCVSKDGSSVDATASQFVRDHYARFGRTITPICDACLLAEAKAEVARLTDVELRARQAMGVADDDRGYNAAYWCARMMKHLRDAKAELAVVKQRAEALEDAAREFIAKVDRGEARSVRSYQAFKRALGEL